MNEDLLRLRGQYMTLTLDHDALTAEIRALASAVYGTVGEFADYGNRPGFEADAERLKAASLQLDRLKHITEQAQALRAEIGRIRPLAGL